MCVVTTVTEPAACRRELPCGFKQCPRLPSLQIKALILIHISSVHEYLLYNLEYFFLM